MFIYDVAYKSIVTKMSTKRNFEFIFDEFNVKSYSFSYC
jgi:hypothetical protein